MNFISLDVETSNPDMASICQVGLVEFSDAKIVQGWKSYITPEDVFSDFHIGIHGIDSEKVKDAPKFPQIARNFQDIVKDKIVVTYTKFDVNSLNRVSKKYKIPRLQFTWLDTSGVVRHTWDKYARDVFGLACVATDLGIKFQHHDALEDAKVCGEVLVRAIEQSGKSIEEWVKQARKPIDISKDDIPIPTIKQKGNPEGYLNGEIIVFTGQLSMPRIQAATRAAEAGCDVEDRITSRTTILVIGNQNLKLLSGKEKSSKHLGAERLISKGAQSRIISEGDFLALIES
ncbi:MAG: transposase [Candidatus Thermoplasmatota archaeon]|nr:transposase [Candidatus Thermoplasmatota archaeon]